MLHIPKNLYDQQETSVGKVISTKSGDLSLIPETYLVDREKQFI